MSDKNDKFDLDALLNEATKGGGSLSPKAENKEEAKPLDGFGERVGGFKIDPREAHITGTDKLRRKSSSLELDPADFRNQVDIKAEAKKRKRLLVILGAMSFLLVLGAIAYVSMPQGSVSDYAQAKPVDDATSQRFLNLYPDAPAADTTTGMVLTTDENGVQVRDGFRLTFAGMEFRNTNFKAVKSTDFGLAAVAEVEGDWNNTQIYLFKDMAHSRAFSGAWDGAEAKVEGAAASAVMLMEFPEGVRAVLAIVNPDSSGYMIVLPANLNYASAENLQNFVRIEDAS